MVIVRSGSPHAPFGFDEGDRCGSLVGITLRHSRLDPGSDEVSFCLFDGGVVIEVTILRTGVPKVAFVRRQRPRRSSPPDFGHPCSSPREGSRRPLVVTILDNESHDF